MSFETFPGRRGEPIELPDLSSIDTSDLLELEARSASSLRMHLCGLVSNLVFDQNRKLSKEIQHRFNNDQNLKSEALAEAEQWLSSLNGKLHDTHIENNHLYRISCRLRRQVRSLTARVNHLSHNFFTNLFRGGNNISNSDDEGSI